MGFVFKVTRGGNGAGKGTLLKVARGRSGVGKDTVYTYRYLWTHQRGPC